MYCIAAALFVAAANQQFFNAACWCCRGSLGSEFGLQLLVMMPLAYICICTYFALFRCVYTGLASPLSWLSICWAVGPVFAAATRMQSLCHVQTVPCYAWLLLTVPETQAG
jgi:hypothetical protein